MIGNSSPPPRRGGLLDDRQSEFCLDDDFTLFKETDNTDNGYGNDEDLSNPLGIFLGEPEPRYSSSDQELNRWRTIVEHLRTQCPPGCTIDCQSIRASRAYIVSPDQAHRQKRQSKKFSVPGERAAAHTAAMTSPVSIAVPTAETGSSSGTITNPVNSSLFNDNRFFSTPFVNPNATQLMMSEDGPANDAANGAAGQHTQHNGDADMSDSLESYDSDNNNGDNGASNGGDNASVGLQSFARLAFADATFHMNTYEVVVGRDQAAIREARKLLDEIDAAEAQAAKDGVQGTRRDVDENIRSKYSQSFYSEKGGFLGPSGPAAWTHQPKTTSAASSSRSASGGGADAADLAAEGDQQPSQSTNQMQNPSDHLIPDREYIPHTPNAVAVNALQHMPSPNKTVFVGIHCPGDIYQMIRNTKAISRHHMRIKFNTNKGVFRASPLHNNGFFVDDEHYSNCSVTLRSGDKIQIKDIVFRFFISGARLGMTGSEEYDKKLGAIQRAPRRRKGTGGKEMSFDFENNDLDSENARDTSSDGADDGGDDSDNSEDNKKANAKANTKANTKAKPAPMTWSLPMPTEGVHSSGVPSHTQPLHASVEGLPAAASSAAPPAPKQHLAAASQANTNAASTAVAMASIPGGAETNRPGDGADGGDGGMPAEIQAMVGQCVQIMERFRQKTEAAQPKKRGPGRPPKNGMYSIREMKACLEAGGLSTEEETLLQATIQSLRHKNRKSKDSNPKEAKEAKELKEQSKEKQQAQHAHQVQQAQLAQQARQAHQAHQAHHVLGETQQQQQQRLSPPPPLFHPQPHRATQPIQQNHAPFDIDDDLETLRQLQNAIRGASQDPALTGTDDAMAYEQMAKLLSAETYENGGRSADLDLYNTAGDSSQQELLRTTGSVDTNARSDVDAVMSDAASAIANQNSTDGTTPFNYNAPATPAQHHGGTLYNSADANGTPSSANAYSIYGTPNAGFADDGTPLKRKVGRPRKHPLPESLEDRSEKRRYKRRKSRDDELTDDGNGSYTAVSQGGAAGAGSYASGNGAGSGGSAGNGSGSNGTAQSKRPERHKTPPLQLRREDYTEEQLAKPNKNYSVLIDEVLTDALPGGLHLKQIYKRIQMKYVYYYFEVETKGWESSVRHNLIGNEAFFKEENTGLWHRMPGVELDAGKKRKASSPDQSSGGSHFQNYGTPSWGLQAGGMAGGIAGFSHAHHQQQHLVDANGLPIPQGFQPQHSHHPAAFMQQQQPPQQFANANAAGHIGNGANGARPHVDDSGFVAQQQHQQLQQQRASPAGTMTPATPGGNGANAMNGNAALYAQQQRPLPTSPMAPAASPAAAPAHQHVAANNAHTPAPAVQQLLPAGAVSTQQQEQQLNTGPTAGAVTQPQQQQQQQQPPIQRPPQPEQGAPAVQRAPDATGGAAISNATGQNKIPMPASPAPPANASTPSPVPAAVPAATPVTAPLASAAPTASTAPAAPAAPAAPTAPTAPTARTATPAPSRPGALARPAVSSELMDLVHHFKAQAGPQIEKLVAHTEETTMIVVNRGLGLSSSTVPGNDQLDGVLFQVFLSAKAQMAAEFDPALREKLVKFKNSFQSMIAQIMGNMAEALVLSAIDQVLGFTDRSMMHPTTDAERVEMDGAEKLIMEEAVKVIEAYQATL